MLGCYGNPTIQTPRIDALAAEGVRFNHCVSTSPVCTPYRGILLSGRHPLHNGAFWNDIQMLPGDGACLAEVLRDAGYYLGYIGKWHLMGGDRDRPIPPGPLRYGFDGLFLSNNCTLEYRAGEAWYWDMDGRRQTYERWEPDAQTDQALAFLDDAANDDRPWALFVSWHPPHNWSGSWQYEAPAEALARYHPDTLRLRPHSPDTPQQRKIYHGYHALCSNLDHNMGRLLDKIQDTGQADDTVVVYTSGHGDTLYAQGRYNQAKCRPEADAARVPLIIRALNLPVRVSDLLIGTLDLPPTLLSLLGVSPPRVWHGRDLAGPIRDQDDDAVGSLPLFCSADNGVDWRGLYTRRYTLSFGPDGDRFDRLYDRQADPWEQTNLFHDPQHRRLRDTLHDQAIAWMRRFGDRLVPFDETIRASIEDPAMLDALTERRLKGPPVDCISGIPGLIK